MIAIRPEQFETLERKAHRDFEDELVAHLKEFSPAHAAGAGDEALRALVRSGLRHAGRHGFELRGSLRFFVECQVMFGHEFDTDPLLPWASSALSDRGWDDEMDRADALHDAALDYRKAVVGDDYEIESAAIGRLLDKSAAEWLGGDAGDAATAQFVREFYPERADCGEPNAVAATVARGKKAAAAYGLPVATGGRLFAALMVAFGSGVLGDPLFPWIAEHLRSESGREPQERVENLATRFLAYLSAARADARLE